MKKQVKQENIFKEMLRVLFLGHGTIKSFFSIEGIIDSEHLVASMISVFFMANILWPEKTYLSYGFWLLLFYCVVAAVQKYCRNIGSTGTRAILLFSLIYILESASYFVAVSIKEALFYQQTDKTCGWFLMIFTILYTSFSSAEEKVAPDVRSPLLKYPLLYVGVVWILCIVATLTVNHFAGVTIPLW